MNRTPATDAAFAALNDLQAELFVLRQVLGILDDLVGNIPRVEPDREEATRENHGLDRAIALSMIASERATGLDESITAHFEIIKSAAAAADDENAEAARS